MKIFKVLEIAIGKSMVEFITYILFFFLTNKVFKNRDAEVEFEEEQSLIDKKKHIKDFLDEYQDIFKRFIDVHELGKYVQEDLILTIKKTIEIY